MNFNIESRQPLHQANIEAALKIIDPSAVITTGHSDLTLRISYTPDFFVRVVAPDLPKEDGVWEFHDLDIADQRYNNEDRRQRLKELIRLGIISIVGKFLHKNPPWGILSGVRPTKIYHYLREKGFSSPEIREKLLAIYGLRESKADLLIEIGALQEKYLIPADYLLTRSRAEMRRVSIYLGIPFCPSRCRYCSFPAVSLETHHHLVKDFLKSLKKEIDTTGDLCLEYGFKVESIYIGGGTPTSLDEIPFKEIVSLMARNFKSDDTVEFTVEAGRPETVTVEKLQIMVNAGVNRICINPQTMNEKTLMIIGRRHSVSEIYHAVAMVKRFPELLLNMDLILGLPGEDRAVFQESLLKIIGIDPDNITIHTLAPKRAASWRKDFYSLDLATSEELDKTADLGIYTLRNHGFQPYYLYRQRLILADRENIGFTKPGKESIYNIQMMEEQQTIIGLGAGAVTKWVVRTGADNRDLRIERLQNPKCPATYSKTVNDLIVKKAQQTRILLG